MAIVSQKAFSLARQISEELNLVYGITVANTFDSAGYPIITFGTATTTNQGGQIKVIAETTPQVDALGNAQRVYVPHKFQITAEVTAASAVVLRLAVALQAKVMSTLLKFGGKVEIFAIASGQNPTFANVAAQAVPTAGEPQYVIECSVWHPLTSSPI